MCARPVSIDAGVRRQTGVTLVELIVFIVVMSVGVVGVLSTMSASVRFSANPMQQKQMTAIAESLLTEILNQPFTFCDPDDANVGTATLSGVTPTCAVAANDQNKGGAPLTSSTPAGETRGAAGAAGFDNVADYGGFAANPITDVTGATVMNGYQAGVAITRAGNTFGLADNGAALQIAVTVTQGTETFTLTGYRFRYVPRY